MAEITEGKYKGLEESKKNEIKSQGGTLVGSPIIRSSDTAFSLNAPEINWDGYQIGDNPITYTGDLIEILNNGNIGTGVSGGGSYVAGSGGITVSGKQYKIIISPTGSNNEFSISLGETTLSTLSLSCSPANYEKELNEITSVNQSLTFTGSISDFVSGSEYKWDHESNYTTMSSNTSITYSITKTISDNSSGNVQKTLYVNVPGQSTLQKQSSFTYKTNLLRYSIGYSTSSDLDFSNFNIKTFKSGSNYTNNGKTLIYMGTSLGSSSIIGNKSTNNGGYYSGLGDSNKYIYIIIPSGTVNPANLYYTSGSSTAISPGGIYKYDDISQYTQNKPYDVLRSENPTYSTDINVRN